MHVIVQYIACFPYIVFIFSILKKKFPFVTMVPLEAFVRIVLKASGTKKQDC